MTVATLSMAIPAQPPVTPAPPVPMDTAGADAIARQLTAAVAGGNETAFRELYDRYQPRLCRLALVVSRGDESLAQEAVQATFITAAAKLRRLDSEAHLWNWLARIARQHLGKAWRQQQRHAAFVELTDLPANPEPADTLLEETLDHALQTLATEERQLIEWFYFDHLSCLEIATRLATTPKAVSSRLERAREKLRTRIHGKP